MRAVSVSASRKPASSVGLHYSVVAEVESSSENSFEVSLDDHVAGKEVNVRSLVQLTY